MRESELNAEGFENIYSKAINKRIEEALDNILSFDEIHASFVKRLVLLTARDIIRCLERIVRITYMYELWQARRRAILRDGVLDEEMLYDELIDRTEIGSLVHKHITTWIEQCEYIIKNKQIYGMTDEDVRQFIRHATGKIGESGVTYKLMRVLRTEGNRAVNKASLKAYEDGGIRKYKYCAILDDKVCSECHELDGEIFSVSEAREGINYPPLHPNCRCYIEPVGDVKFDISFKEWQDRYLSIS